MAHTLTPDEKKELTGTKLVYSKYVEVKTMQGPLYKSLFIMRKGEEIRFYYVPSSSFTVRGWPDFHNYMWLGAGDGCSADARRIIANGDFPGAEEFLGHRAQTSEDYGWVHCITPDECAAEPGRQAAHGNIVRVDTCSCGATRETEINHPAKNYGPWVKPEEAE